MNETSTKMQGDAAGESTPAAEAKVRKPRAPRKTAAAVSDKPSAEQGAVPAEQAEPVAAKPVRKRSASTKAPAQSQAPVVAGRTEAVEAVAEATEPAVAAPRKRAARKPATAKPVASAEVAAAHESAQAVQVPAHADAALAPIASAEPTVAAPQVEPAQASSMETVEAESLPSSSPRSHGDGGHSPQRQQRRGPSQGRERQPAKSGYAFADVVSGELDAEQDAEDNDMPAKRVLAPQVDSPKLHKVLAQAGMGSRLEMEQLILEGRISVNNEPAHIGQRIQFGDVVKVNGKPIRFRIDPPPARVIAYHKPVGEVVTHDDPQNRPTVFRKLPKLQNGKWQSVGRLDLNTEGLLLFTSSGELANSLMHPRFGLEREYAARVLGALSNEEKQRLLDGVQLEDGEAAFGSIEDGGGEGANHWYRVTISEGRNREVRRLFEAVGHAVSRLIRIRYGAMMLPRGLKRGAWVELDQGDIQALSSAAGMQARAPSERNAGAGGRGTGSRNSRGGRGGSAGRGNGFNTDRPAQGRREGGGQRRSEWDGNRPAPSGMLGDGARVGKSSANRAGGSGRAQNSQPDPMRTSVGYIGGDSLSRARQNAKRGPGGGGGGRRRGGGR